MIKPMFEDIVIGDVISVEFVNRLGILIGLYSEPVIRVTSEVITTSYRTISKDLSTGHWLVDGYIAELLDILKL